MNDPIRFLPGIWAVLAVVAFLLTALSAASGLIETTELQAYDFLLSTRRPASWPQDLVVLDFDDHTLDSIGRFPIPRRILAEVVNKVATGGPAVIGVDILLDEQRDLSDDRKLSEALGAAGNVILAENFGGAQLPPSVPLPQFRDQALEVSFVNLPIDPDGLIRRMFLWMRTPDYSGISFPVALVSNYIGQPLLFGARGKTSLGQIRIPWDGDSPNVALIGHWSEQPAPSVPVWRLLESSANCESETPESDISPFRVNCSARSTRSFHATSG